MLGSVNIVAFVPTKDPAMARSFYEGVLGLRFVKDDGFALVLDANGIMIELQKLRISSRHHSPFWDGRFQKSRKSSPHFMKKAFTSRFSVSCSKTSWAFGGLPAATRWLGSKTPTGMFCR
jgi:hypothetical protein